MVARFVKIFLTIIFFVKILNSQTIDSVEVEIKSDIVQYESISVIKENNSFYLSINELASKLSLPVYQNFVLKKGELNIGDYLVKFSNNNHFVVITDQTNYKRWVEQIKLPALIIDSNIYVESVEVVEKFKKFGNIELNFENKNITNSDFDIIGYSIIENENELKFIIPTKTNPTKFELKQNKQNSFSVELYDCRIEEVKVPEYLLSPFVKNENNNSTISFVFRQQLSIKSVELSFDEKNKSINIKIILKKNVLQKIDPVIKSEKNKITTSANIDQEKKRWELDMVIIDPGHGGRDPGSIGVTGTKEKDVTLGISLKLGELIKKNLKGIKVGYTRKNDSFVELFRRGKFANDLEGKLFISIHCNSFDSDKQSPAGFEIYLLRPGKTDEAVKIASRENDVVKLEADYTARYEELTEENFILLTMAQSSFIKQSEDFAEILQREMSKKLTTESRGVKQAGFYVLVGASMPNVLIETGYLSNSDEEEKLKSEEGQKLIAESIFSAIDKYKLFYETKILED
ncbi:MAG: N-acetylmuramoyl-L-alanine amidase [Bacteroidetes bacterium]|nr:N-acetylmuramoyl-L-alanine amidase [Bacteroidota bacterium]